MLLFLAILKGGWGVLHRPRARAVLASHMASMYPIHSTISDGREHPRHIAIAVLLLRCSIRTLCALCVSVCLDITEMWQWSAATPPQFDTECDSSSSDNDMAASHPLPLAWEVSEVPRSMSSNLVPIPMVSNQVPKTIEECTPAALLPAALRKDSPDINFQPPLKRRRCIGKQECLEEYGRILRQLQHDCTSSLLPW